MFCMQITVRSLKHVELVTITGRIDGEAVHEFENELRGLIERNRRKIILNLAETEYINSGALRSMVSALKECKRSSGNLVLASVSSRVLDTMGLVGFNSLFESFADVVSAVDSFS